MKLYLVRHGQAVESSVHPERPLSEAGIVGVRQVAENLKSAKLKGSVRTPTIYHSGKVRARQTAEIVAAIIFPEAQPTEHRGLNPNDPPDAWLPEIAAFNDDLALVGHLPFMGVLAGLLLTGQSPPGMDFPVACVACFERHEGEWSLSWRTTPNDVS